MRILILMLFFTISLFASIELDHFKTLPEIKKFLNTLDTKDSLTLELINAIQNKRDSDAKFLLNLLKNSSKEDTKLENLLYHPKHFSVIIVSKNKQQLKLIYNEQNNTKIIDLPCITGKRAGDKLKAGDKKTPSGVYFAKWFIPQEKLTPIYGIGAFPLNYPNIIDKKIYKKTGDGIWLHATNDDHRKPFSSNGCVVVTNKNFAILKPHIFIKNTPIVIIDDFSYVKRKDFEKTKLSLGYFLYKWKRAWEHSTNGKYKEYVSYYSKHLVSPYGDKKAFEKYKRSVAQGKKWIKISINNLYLTKDGRVLNYGHIYVASFDTDYRSNNYTWHGKKILYIIKEDGKWKILAEESL